MLLAGETEERSMSKPSLDGRHRDKNGEISHKHGNTLIRTLRKIYGPGFAAGYPETEKLSEVLLQLNETSLSQLRRDHETGHLEHKIAQASKGGTLSCFHAQTAVIGLSWGRGFQSLTNKNGRFFNYRPSPPSACVCKRVAAAA